MKERKHLIFFILFALFVSNCGFAKETIKVGVLPIVEVLPIYVAHKERYFDEAQVMVEIVPCASASERDQLLAASAVDVVVNDLVSIALNNKEKINIVGVRYAMIPNERFFQFAIVSSKTSNIKKPSELKGVPIGISNMTIVHYVTERLLLTEGIKPEEIKTVPIPRIADRLSALMRGDLKAACLPEPFATLAISRGANLLLDDRNYPFFSGSLYSARKEFAEKNAIILSRFLLSIDKAVTAINKEKEKWRGFAVEKKLIPPVLSEKYVLPDFPKGEIPSEKTWNDVIFWLKKKGAIKGDVSYHHSITQNFLRR